MTIRSIGRTLAMLGSLVLAGVAAADPPCLDDIKKFCANTQGAGQVQACLKSHETELSADCKAHAAEMKRTAGTLAAICIWDIERFCSEVPSGGGRIADCLKANRDELSPECRAQFDAPAK